MILKNILSKILLGFGLLTFFSNFVTYASDSEDDALDYSYLNNFQDMKDLELEEDWTDIPSHDVEVPNTNSAGLKVMAGFKTAGKIGLGILSQVGNLMIDKYSDKLLGYVATPMFVADQIDRSIEAGKGIRKMYKDELQQLKNNQ